MVYSNQFKSYNSISAFKNIKKLIATSSAATTFTSPIFSHFRACKEVITRTCLFRVLIKIGNFFKGEKMKKLIAPRMERCIGCHSCSLSCARQVHQRLSWDTAGIRIHSAGGCPPVLRPGPVWPACRLHAPRPAPPAPIPSVKAGALLFGKNYVSTAAPVKRPARWTPSSWIQPVNHLCVCTAADVYLSALTTVWR